MIFIRELLLNFLIKILGKFFKSINQYWKSKYLCEMHIAIPSLIYLGTYRASYLFLLYSIIPKVAKKLIETYIKYTIRLK